jgi:hypothetical protein
VFATHSIKNIRKSIEQLKSFCRKNEKLKRAPIFKFSSGTEVLCTCFVKTVGNIRYDEPRQDGTVRSATFEVVLLKVDDVPTELGKELDIGALLKTGLGIISAAASNTATSISNFINIPGGSLHKKGRRIIVKSGETFEHIARKEYSNALYGDVLRRAHFNKPLSIIKPALEVGDIIDLVDESDIRNITITPQSIPLKGSITNLKNIKDHFELRGGERIIYV